MNNTIIQSVGLNSTLNITYNINFDKFINFDNESGKSFAITFWNLTFINPASCGNATSFYQIFNITAKNNSAGA